MISLFVFIFALGVVGNTTLWISFWNHTQGTAMPEWLNKSLSMIAKLGCLLLPIVILLAIFSSQSVASTVIGGYAYLAFCVAITLVGLPYSFYRRVRRRRLDPSKLIQTKRYAIETDASKQVELPGLRNKLLFHTPSNQVLEFEETTKELVLPGLSRNLDNLKIAHLTDVHFTGMIPRSYFEQAIDAVNAMDADIIAITGDLVDKRKCYDWFPHTFGRLRAKHGVYGILGNHDRKQTLWELRKAITACGVKLIGDRIKSIVINGEPIFLIGNELPWIPPAPEMAELPDRKEFQHLRILLSHSPDQLNWARANDIDLMLAGHTHGGQFCLPWFGAFACPSRIAMEFCSGTSYEEPTLLHVSRGLSSEIPLRINCRPEITQLVLRCPSKTDSQEKQYSGETRGSSQTSESYLTSNVTSSTEFHSDVQLVEN